MLGGSRAYTSLMVCVRRLRGNGCASCPAEDALKRLTSAFSLCYHVVVYKEGPCEAFHLGSGWIRSDDKKRLCFMMEEDLCYLHLDDGPAIPVRCLSSAIWDDASRFVALDGTKLPSTSGPCSLESIHDHLGDALARLLISLMEMRSGWPVHRALKRLVSGQWNVEDVSKNIHLIWGPPGTGKSLMCAKEASSCKGTVLMLAKANSSVDGLYAKTKSLDGSVIRIGHGRGAVDCKTAMSMDGQARVVVTTIAQMVSHPGYFIDFRGAFDTVVVDEAGTVELDELFLASLHARQKLVIAGDPMQLGAIGGDGFYDAFDVIRQGGALEGAGLLTVLEEQHRMPEAISSFVSSQFYNGRLKTASDAGVNWPECHMDRLFPDAMNALDTSEFALSTTTGPDGSHSSFVNALFSALTALDWTEACGVSVGVISPYKAQCKLIKDLLFGYFGCRSDVFVDTVHGFQGQEKDVVILDLTDSYPGGPGVLYRPGLDEMRLANVALSRTKGKFIVIGDMSLFRDGAMGALTARCKEAEAWHEKRPRTLSRIIADANAGKRELFIGDPGPNSRHRRADGSGMTAWKLRHVMMKDLIGSDDARITYFMSSGGNKSDVMWSAFPKALMTWAAKHPGQLCVVYQEGDFKLTEAWKAGHPGIFVRKLRRANSPVPFALIEMPGVDGPVVIQGLFHSAKSVHGGSSQPCVVFHDGKRFMSKVAGLEPDDFLKTRWQ